MPLYEYYCSACTQKFEKLRSSELARLEAHCPECGSFSRRIVSVFARRSKNVGGQDVSLTERLPEISGGGCGCGASCACGSGFGLN